MNESDNANRNMLITLIHSYITLENEAQYILESIMDVYNIPREYERMDDLKGILETAGSPYYKWTCIEKYAVKYQQQHHQGAGNGNL